MDVVAVAGRAVPCVDRHDDTWLANLAQRLRPADHVLGTNDPAPVLHRGPHAVWYAGDVAGELSFLHRRLVICPPGRSEATRFDLTPALAALWCQLLEAATRHGPPAIHQEMPHVGPSLRGRLDVRGTTRLRSKGSVNVASTYRTRDLHNALTRALVAADHSLTRQIGHDRWHTRRVQEVMPQLHHAVGRRAALPTLSELGRIRYSPITRPFRAIAELSVRIVLQDPVVTTIEYGRPQGLLMELQTIPARTA